MHRVLVLTTWRQADSEHALKSGLAGLHQKPEVLMLDLHFTLCTFTASHALIFTKKSPLMNSFEASF